MEARTQHNDDPVHTPARTWSGTLSWTKTMTADVHMMEKTK